MPPHVVASSVAHIERRLEPTVDAPPPHAPIALDGRDRPFLWLSAALTLAVALLAIDPLPVGVFYDDAQYVILGKALATGHGFRFLNLPGAPLATHFPPGYPLVLALLWKISPNFPENVALFKFVNAALLALVAALVFRFARRTLALPAALSFIAAIAGTATIPSLVLSSSVMSEPLFLALLFPLLAAIERASSSSPHDDDRRQLRAAIFLGAAIAAITLVRTHGIVLVPAAAAVYIAHGRRRAAVACILSALALLAPWFVWVQLHDAALPPLLRGAYGSYSGWLLSGLQEQGMRLLLLTIPDNLATIGWAIARCLVPSGLKSVELIALASYAVLCAAALPSLWRSARALVLFVALYLGIVVVWPFSPLRFVWGIWPLLMLFPIVGARVLWSAPARVGRWPARRAAAAVACTVLCAGTVWFNASGYANAWWASNARFHARRILGQLSWVAGATRPDDVIASDTEGAVYLYTARHTVPITSFTAAEYVREPTAEQRIRIMQSLLDRYAPRYIVVTSPPLIDAATRLAESNAPALERVDTIPRGGVYRRR